MSQPNFRDDLETGETDPLNRNAHEEPPTPTATRSIYALTRQEITKGVANRFVHSRTYIILYLAMAALSITTIVLSITDDCPGLAFYILEIIINTAMILEVGIRFVAFGRQFWKSPFNIVDLVLTIFCALTLLVLAFAKCGSTSKEEEILDTLLLVARNVLQFSRLAAVMRQSGQSIFSRPRPIDINAARRAGYTNLDIDIESDDEDDTELARPLVRNPIVFDADQPTRQQREPLSEMPLAAHSLETRDAEDIHVQLVVWPVSFKDLRIPVIPNQYVLNALATERKKLLRSFDSLFAVLPIAL
ncbi:wsc domain-containing protein [Lentinula edodes]|uniref:Wsc domain-containing protein n=1 Tax=Lentinula edodes TaxID=5353 RepID=A0A1Q3EIN3_LENED|nr:wsc domain-containing protein [Lentinula edodes]